MNIKTNKSYNSQWLLSVVRRARLALIAVARTNSGRISLSTIAPSNNGPKFVVLNNKKINQN
jgi:hypothetical protein